MFNELVSNAMHSTPQGFVGVSLIFVKYKKKIETEK